MQRVIRPPLSIFLISNYKTYFLKLIMTERLLDFNLFYVPNIK